MTHTLYPGPLPDAAPPLILIIPDARVDALPEPLAAVVRRCESAYHAGRWYVTMPADLAGQLQMEPTL